MESDHHEQRFRSRKFILTSFAMLAAVGLCVIGKMSGGEASAIILSCVAAYNWANVKSQ